MTPTVYSIIISHPLHDLLDNNGDKSSYPTKISATENYMKHVINRTLKKLYIQLSS